MPLEKTVFYNPVAQYSQHGRSAVIARSCPVCDLKNEILVVLT